MRPFFMVRSLGEMIGVYAKDIQHQVTTSGCWECTSHAKDEKGYPRVHRGARMVHLSRIIYAQHNGPVRDDLDVCHRCDNPSCINPDHLFLGSRAENMHDSLSKRRSVRQRLTPDDVRTIRRSRGADRFVMAARFGISVRHLRKVLNGELWSWVT